MLTYNYVYEKKSLNQAHIYSESLRGKAKFLLQGGMPKFQK